MVNFAENQRLRDSKEAPLTMCRGIGSSHACYGWSRTPDGHWNTEQQQAYYDGYDTAMKAAQVQ